MTDNFSKKKKLSNWKFDRYRGKRSLHLLSNGWNPKRNRNLKIDKEILQTKVCR